jgi:endonuclease/exonuclease/phosphatase (EEP) superfamily protein YafD
MRKKSNEAHHPTEPSMSPSPLTPLWRNTWPTTLALLPLCLLVLTLLANLATPFYQAHSALAWIPDAFNAFRLQYFALSVAYALLLGGLALAWPKQRAHLLPATALLALPLLLNGWEVIPFYLPTAAPQAKGPTFKLLHLNVHNSNTNVQATQRFIASQQAAVVNLQEYTAPWRKALEATGVLNSYPHRFHVDGGDDALYSRIPLESVKAERIAGSPHGSDVAIVARLRWQGHPLTLVASHPPIPVLGSLYERQRQHVAWWAHNKAAYGPRWVLLGDLNTTPWSLPYKSLVAGTGLRDSQRGVGVQLSFPADVLWPLMSIDHALASEGVVLRQRRVGGGETGSDHLPLQVEVGVSELTP